MPLWSCTQAGGQLHPQVWGWDVGLFGQGFYPVYPTGTISAADRTGQHDIPPKSATAAILSPKGSSCALPPLPTPSPLPLPLLPSPFPPPLPIPGPRPSGGRCWGVERGEAGDTLSIIQIPRRAGTWSSQPGGLPVSRWWGQWGEEVWLDPELHLSFCCFLIGVKSTNIK